MKNFFNKIFGEKQRYRDYRKAVDSLPEPYSQTLKELEKYMWNFAKSGGFMHVLEELLDMFQESAAENVPVNHIIGDDPVAFADSIMAQYPDELWLVTYQERLRVNIRKVLEG